VVKAILISLVVLFNSGKMIAQETTGIVKGKVVTENEEGIANTNVQIFGKFLQGNRGTVSDVNGNFRIIALPAGIYTMSIQNVAYQNLKLEDVHIKIGAATDLGTIKMAPRIHELDEVFVIENESLFDPTSTTSGNNILSSTFNQFPLQRDYSSVSLLTPQVNKGFGNEPVNISGSTGLENIFYIDGINVTDPADAASSIKLPYNFIQEVEIITGGYNAEYGKALGGIVNVITPGGSNTFETNLFGFITGNSLSANKKLGFTEAAVPNFHNYDFGGSVSGAFIHDKLWFYGAYSPSFEEEEINIAGLGNFKQKIVFHPFAGKLKWQPAKNTNIVFIVLGDPTFRNLVFVDETEGLKVINADAIREKREMGGVNLSLTAQQIINENFILEAKIYRLIQRETTEPETSRGKVEPLVVDYFNGTVSGGRPITQNDKYSRTGVDISGALFWGSHSFKSGFTFEDNRYQIDITNLSPYSWVIRTADSTYITQYLEYKGNVSNRVLSFYLQDSWKLNDYFRINAGVRWDGQYFIGNEGNLVQSITAQIQPRGGFIYTPMANGNSKLFGFYGRFFEQIPSRFLAFNYLDRKKVITVFDHDPAVNPNGGMVNDLSSLAQTKIDGLKGESYDEFILGYEQKISYKMKASVKGIYRETGYIIDDFIDPSTGTYIIGNPGKGKLEFFPKLIRIYRALEFSFQKIEKDEYGFIASYVLSSNSGNYTGVFNSYSGDFLPNSNFIPDIIEQTNNSTGLLPNDRTHVFKFSGFYNFGYGFTTGTNIIWQSGTPLTEYGADPYGLVLPVFVSQQGTAGRTPALIKTDLRIKYDLAYFLPAVKKINLVVDVFNIFNTLKPVTFDQQHYLGSDANGNQIFPNPNYMTPIQYNQPRMVRVGLETTF
jgi:hypothetical protein